MGVASIPGFHGLWDSLFPVVALDACDVAELVILAFRPVALDVLPADGDALAVGLDALAAGLGVLAAGLAAFLT